MIPTTAVKERLVELLPEIPDLIPNITDDQAEQVFNIFFTVKPDIGGISLGIAEGQYKIPEDINAFDDEIEEMFGV